jgi:hypothetical protein
MPDNNAAPHSVEAEQSVLGRLMLDNTTWPKVADSLNAGDFYRPDHRLIFAAIASLAAVGEPMDAVTIAEQLERGHNLESGGGLGYLATLTRETASGNHIEAYADIVRNHAQLRRLKEVGERLGQAQTLDDARGAIALLSAINVEAKGDGALTFLKLDEFLVKPTMSWLVADLIPSDAIVVVFGPPKNGKTFATCDIAMHSAHCMNWHGHAISKQLRVAFMAGEGRNGLRVRLKAWLSEHAPSSEGSFVILPEAIGLPTRTREVTTALAEFKPDLIVVDTLNAFFGEGDENSTADMTAFVSAVRYIRDQLQCSILVIHHTGLTETTRERGSSVLRGAADVVVRVAKDESGPGLVALQVIDGRDIEPWESPIGLRLRRVDSDWLDSEGNPLTTCIVESADQTVTLPGQGSKPPTAAQQIVITAVQELAFAERKAPGDVLLARADISKAAVAKGANRSSVYRNLQQLAPRMGWRLPDSSTVVVRQP